MPFLWAETAPLRPIFGGPDVQKGHRPAVRLRWQRRPSFQKLADMLLKHLDGILNYCRTKVRFGVVEAINGNIRMLINRGRGYKNMRYILLKAKRMTATNTEYVAFRQIKKAA